MSILALPKLHSLVGGKNKGRPGASLFMLSMDDVADVLPAAGMEVVATWDGVHELLASIFFSCKQW